MNKIIVKCSMLFISTSNKLSDVEPSDSAQFRCIRTLASGKIRGPWKQVDFLEPMNGTCIVVSYFCQKHNDLVEGIQGAVLACLKQRSG